ncbi:hypothetical protein [Fodinibius halophilus]|uniref:Uncharacterized protein n=1 Tax=Fodinibius halophilus TaxID=1736908 RepID=A0A6M1T5H6_9BACT|nr:hypothetical protein [Fodinibius halophilus]NGP87903.1 hypothetical protein [Fodinibius halophilus]
MLKHLLIVVLIAGGLYYYWTTRPVTHGPGVVAPETPVQKTTYNRDKIDYKEFTIIPKAKLKLEARILSIQQYYFDKYTDLTPTDVVFGWGPMSDETNLESLMVRQSERSFYWEMARPPLKQQKMWKHAANMHLIGSTQKIRDKISSLRQGQIVQVKGFLVNVSSPEGWELKTSLTRDDIGDDSSEVVWIKSLTIL